jgi:hypothetical protein
MIQEGQAPDRERAALEDGLRRIGEDSFGEVGSKTDISWVVVGKGYAWTAGKPSTSSIVVRSVPVGFEPDRREAFMRKVCDLWTSVSGCSINEIVVTAWDGPLPL